MKSKKFLLVVAIITSVLMIGFGLGAIIFCVSPPSAKGFTEDIKYLNGTVKDVNSDLDNKTHIIVLENHNTRLMVYGETMNNLFSTLDLQAGNSITFGVSQSSSEIIEKDVEAIVQVVFLSCEDRNIVSLETYEQMVINDMNISKMIFIVGAIMFFCIAFLCYILYFKSKMLIKRNTTK